MLPVNDGLFVRRGANDETLMASSCDVDVKIYLAACLAGKHGLIFFLTRQGGGAANAALALR
jgi:hypothetical protein